jgi:2-dehydropantoate 2-reductase
MLPPLVGRDTLVVPLQNGVDSVETLTREVGDAHVLGGTAYVSAVIAEPGVIRHTAMSRLIFGPVSDASGASGGHPAVLDELLRACTRAGLEATLSDRVLVDIWVKFVRLTVFSGVTSIARSPIGVVRSDPDLAALMEAALRESIAVARGRHIPLPHSLHGDVLSSLSALPPHAKSSMLEDLERGRRIELPWLSGALVRIGREAGVDTPTHRLIVALLTPHVNGASPR